MFNVLIISLINKKNYIRMKRRDFISTAVNGAVGISLGSIGTPQ